MTSGDDRYQVPNNAASQEEWEKTLLMVDVDANGKPLGVEVLS